MSNKPKFCGKCGSSLKDNVKFCTNCGTEINSDVKIQRTTRDEFLKKYYGTKILDHINEIIQANIGDKQRLEAIYHLIENKQELDYVNFYYLKECSDKYNTINPNQTIPKQHTSKKKLSLSNYKLVGIAIMMIFISIIVIAASVSSDNHNSNGKNNDNREMTIDLASKLGYVPSWAVALSPYQILEKCAFLDKTSVDIGWCNKWANFVQEQRGPEYIENEQLQKTVTNRICKEKEICAYPKEFLKYKISSTDTTQIKYGTIYFDDEINPFTIQSYNIGFGSKPLLWIIDKQDRTRDNARFSIEGSSFDHIIPLPVKKSLETLSVQGGIFSSIQKFTDGEITNEKVTFENKIRDIYVFKSHPDPRTKYFEQREFDSQTGVLMLYREGGVMDGENWEYEEKLIDTNIFDYSTEINSNKQ